MHTENLARLEEALASSAADLARRVGGGDDPERSWAAYGARRVAELERGLASRDVTGQATGILIERFALDDAGAYDLLVRSSQDTDIELVDLARWLVRETIERPVAAGEER